jgi:hypothetical protein
MFVDKPVCKGNNACYVQKKHSQSSDNPYTTCVLVRATKGGKFAEETRAIGPNLIRL